MEILKTLFIHFKKNTSIYFFIFLALLTFDRHHRYEASTDPERYGPFESDVAQYYSFLPATFYQVKDSMVANFQNNIFFKDF